MWCNNPRARTRRHEDRLCQLLNSFPSITQWHLQIGLTISHPLEFHQAFHTTTRSNFPCSLKHTVKLCCTSLQHRHKQKSRSWPANLGWLCKPQQLSTVYKDTHVLLCSLCSLCCLQRDGHKACSSSFSCIIAFPQAQGHNTARSCTHFSRMNNAMDTSSVHTAGAVRK